MDTRNNGKPDKFTLLVWMFEAQYSIASKMEGTLKHESKAIFSDVWRQMKRLSKWLNRAYKSLEDEKNLGEDVAFDDMAEAGEAIELFCEKYMDAEKQGRQDHFMGYLKNWK